jgi:bifunctional UDP-N-acetylglucosamine pyrophosphorylase/glucosamine-1-phosphate N-acetyltransferase
VIHDTTVIYGKVEVHADALVGPFCVLGFRDDGVSGAADDRIIIGRGVTLSPYCSVGTGTALGVGVWCDHHTYIGSKTVIEEEAQLLYSVRVYDRVRIGRGAWVAGFVCNDSKIGAKAICMGRLIHRFVNAVEGVPERAPVVEDGAFVGMGSTVIGPVVVGAGAYIASGSVLTHSAKPGRLYRGIPARECGPAPPPWALASKAESDALKETIL